MTPEQIRAGLDRLPRTFPQSAAGLLGEESRRRPRVQEGAEERAVELKPVEVTVRELEWLDRSDLGPRTSDSASTRCVRLRIVCSAGFYVRSLAHDIGQVLGCGAHLEALRRTRAGQFRVADALTLDAIEAAGPAIEGRLIGLNALLADMPAVTPDRRGQSAGRQRQHAGPGPPGRRSCDGVARTRQVPRSWTPPDGSCRSPNGAPTGFCIPSSS